MTGTGRRRKYVVVSSRAPSSGYMPTISQVNAIASRKDAITLCSRRQSTSIFLYTSGYRMRRKAAPRSVRHPVVLLLRKNNNSGDSSGANKGRAILHNCRRIYRRRNQEMSQLFGSGRANFTLGVTREREIVPGQKL
ncbi:hypothetical protein PUN28_013148 [Cardiocondyla obscurior]|uniref:Uncharacterized protein n=1 Tax=Cardiocondyla obscurior TaxID=286306 RepID=A0AAW2F6Y1_9HYME